MEISKSVKVNSAILMLIAIFSKVIGLARDLTLSMFWGASNITDAYVVSNTIPEVIFAFIGLAISTGFIPIYTEVLSKNDKVYSNDFVNTIINVLLIICAGFILICSVFSKSITKIFAMGFDEPTLLIASNLMKISIVGMLFSIFVYVFIAFLQVHGEYRIPSLIGLPLNITIIIFILLSKIFDYRMLAVGSLMAVFMQALFLYINAKKFGYEYKFSYKFRDKNLKAMIMLSLPIILGVSVTQVNVLLDRTLASNIVVGGITALNYANRLVLFAQGIIIASIVAVFYPVITQMAVKNDIERIKVELVESMKLLLLLLIPAMIGMMFYSNEIVSIVFFRGAFDANDLSITSSAMFFYALGLIGIGLREMFSKIFFALKETKIPMKNTSIGVGINIVLNIILSRIMGISGLALATSIAAIITAVILFFDLRKLIGKIDFSEMKMPCIKIVFSGLVMGFGSKLVYYQLLKIMNLEIAFLLSVGVAVVLYIIMAYILKVEEVNYILDKIRKHSLDKVYNKFS